MNHQILARQNPCNFLKMSEWFPKIAHDKQWCSPKGPKLGFEYLPTYKTLHCVRTVCMAFPWYKWAKAQPNKSPNKLRTKIRTEFEIQKFTPVEPPPPPGGQAQPPV